MTTLTEEKSIWNGCYNKITILTQTVSGPFSRTNK